MIKILIQNGAGIAKVPNCIATIIIIIFDKDALLMDSDSMLNALHFACIRGTEEIVDLLLHSLTYKSLNIRINNSN